MAGGLEPRPHDVTGSVRGRVCCRPFCNYNSFIFLARYLVVHNRSLRGSQPHFVNEFAWVYRLATT